MAIFVFGVGQLVIPAIATSVVRGRVDRYGKVVSVSVSAFPAVELAFGDADSVTVHMSSYHAPASSMARNLSQAAGVTNLKVRVDTVTSGLFTATDAHLTKHGAKLVGSGQISEASLQQAIPGLESVKLLSSSGGQLTLAGDESGVTVDLVASASDGKIVVSGTGLLSLFHFTVWSDPMVRVTALSGHSTRSGLALSATARMN